MVDITNIIACSLVVIRLYTDYYKPDYHMGVPLKLILRSNQSLLHKYQVRLHYSQQNIITVRLHKIFIYSFINTSISNSSVF